MALSPGARHRGLVTLQLINFLMYCGFFMVIPLVSVHYVEGLGFAAAVVGLALAMRQLIQQGTAIFGGMMADRFGVRRLIALGVLVRVVGFLSLAWASTVPLLFLSMLLAAIGGALFEAPSRAAIAALTTEENRARYYSITSIVSGLAMTIGPLVGALLIRFDFRLVCLGAATCFVLVFAVTLLTLPPVQVASQQGGFGDGVSLALHDRPFLLFTALLMGYWFMWVQITLSLPLAAESLTRSSDSVGIIYALNAGTTVLLQYPLLRLAERWLSAMQILILGVVLMALGLGAVALAQSFPALLACVLLFALGVLLATPTQQTVTANLADTRALGSYFGISAMALAFGGSAGNFVGGWLTDVGRSINFHALPWLVFCSLGLASALGLALLAAAQRASMRPQKSGVSQ
ncbi:MAG: MFS transporter [Chloroflexaceae bacterium]|jgi:DHA1 family multidrug resistance protein-like MFS transporter|nr:MFS transporter [Chloroflexaceae bacterium]